MASYDGYLQFQTLINNDDFIKGINKLPEIAEKSLNAVVTLADSVFKGIEKSASLCAEAAKNSVDVATNTMKEAEKQAPKSTSATIAKIKKILANIATIAKNSFSAMAAAAETAFKGIQKAASLCANAVKASINLTVNAMQAVGQQAGKLVSSAIDVGKSFESSMSQVIATMGFTKDSLAEVTNGETGETEMVNAYEMLAAKAKEMGATTKFSATEAADALNYLALAGYDAQKACEALPVVLNLAAAGGMELADASDLVTDAMSALGIEATYDNLTHFSDVLAKTASRSNTSVSQLGEAMLVCGGQCRTAGVELEDAATMLGILADNGIKGSEGGTALRNLLKNLYTPTQAAADAMATLGIKTKDDVTENLRDAQDVLIDTMAALEGLSEADRMTYMGALFDTRTIAAASATLNNSTERYNELKNEILACDGACEQMAETMSDNLEGSLAICQSSAEALGNTFYVSISGGLREVVDMASDRLTALNNLLENQGFSGLAKGIGNTIEEAIRYAFTAIPKVTRIADEFVATLADSISSKQMYIEDLASDTILTLVDSFTKNFNKFYSLGWEITATLAKGIAKNSSKITEIAKNSTYEFVAAIASNLPTVIDCGIDIVSAVVDGFIEAVNNPSFEFKASVMVLRLSSIFSENIPAFLEFATDSITYIAEKMTENAPSFFQTAYNIVSMIGGYILDNIGLLAQCAVDLIISFCNFLSEHSEEFVNTAVFIVTTIADFIIENIEPLTVAAFEIIEKLATALITEQNLDKLLPAVLEIVQSIANMIKDNLDDMLDAATEIIGALLRYINDPQNQEQLFTAAGDIVGTLINAMCNEDNFESLQDFIAMLLVELGKLVFATDWSDIGKNIAEGIVSGILGVEWDAEEAKKTFFADWATGFNDITQRLGIDFEGLNTDIIASADSVQRSNYGGLHGGGGGGDFGVTDSGSDNNSAQTVNVYIGEEKLDGIVARSNARNSFVTGGGGY